jgi:hypothetical protein
MKDCITDVMYNQHESINIQVTRWYLSVIILDNEQNNPPDYGEK